MNKRTTFKVLFHIICWILVALPTVFFVPQQVQQSLAMYLIKLCVPLFLCIIFYINYLWLVPRYLVNKRLDVYIGFNLAVIVFFFFCIDSLMVVMHDLERAAGWMPPPPPGHVSVPMRFLFTIAKNVFPFVLSAALATSLRLALNWQAAEAARKEMEIQKTEAELSNLRSQVNPHFLLNTLNNIYALISFDRDKAQSAVLSLSALLRQMLYGGQNNTVSLKEEIEFIRHYVELMRIRQSKNVKIDFDVSVLPDKDVNVAPFILISLVENAFKHGVSTTYPSFISIFVSYDGTKVVYDIRNSNFPKSDADKSGHGIGLEQVARRLDLAYSGNYEWKKGTDDTNKVYYSKIIIYDTQLCDNR